MADKGPNWKAEQLKLRIVVENLKVNIHRSRLEIIESEGRIVAAETNIESTRKAISEGEQRLQDLVKKHGNLIEGVLNDG